MHDPFDHISGQIIIKGRFYSAKEVVRGLLEQGIAITESSEGLKIGFKLFSPQSSSAEINTDRNDFAGCPFIPYMSQINARLDDLNSRLDSQKATDISSSKYFSSSSPSKDSVTSSISPFTAPSFQSSRNREKEKFFSSDSGIYDNRQKCPSCGAVLSQNAFFCNKCGDHVRSG